MGSWPLLPVAGLELRASALATSGAAGKLKETDTIRAKFLAEVQVLLEE